MYTPINKITNDPSLTNQIILNIFTEVAISCHKDKVTTFKMFKDYISAAMLHYESLSDITFDSVPYIHIRETDYIGVDQHENYVLVINDKTIHQILGKILNTFFIIPLDRHRPTKSNMITAVNSKFSITLINDIVNSKNVVDVLIDLIHTGFLRSFKFPNTLETEDYNKYVNLDIMNKSSHELFSIFNAPSLDKMPKIIANVYYLAPAVVFQLYEYISKKLNLQNPKSKDIIFIGKDNINTVLACSMYKEIPIQAFIVSTPKPIV